MPGRLIELYGLLETGFHTYTRFSDDPAKVNGTIGRVVSSMELKILDEAGREASKVEVGEITALGHSEHLCYHAHAAARYETFNVHVSVSRTHLSSVVEAT